MRNWCAIPDTFLRMLHIECRLAAGYWRILFVKIKLAENFRAVFYAPFYAAQALGFYAREGVEIELLSSSVPGDAVTALLACAIDITWGGPMRVMKAHDRDPNSPLVCFCEVVARDPFYLVGRSNGAAFELTDLPRLNSPRCPRSLRRGCAFSTICASRASIPIASPVLRIGPCLRTSRCCATNSSTSYRYSNRTYPWL